MTVVPPGNRAADTPQPQLWQALFMHFKLTTLILPLAAAVALAVSGCSKSGDAPAVADTKVAVNSSVYDTVAATGKGFTVGAMMSAQPVYVLFEPQCPHCGHLWQASVALHNQVKFIWIPVAFNTGKSVSQAAALLTAANPAEAMSAHEQSLLTGQGGIAEASNVPDELAAAIKANTQLLTTLGVDSVPLLVAKNRKTGEVVTHNGALETAALSTLLGLN
jgi:thiol:disulfide interchange protein DsbG